MNVTWYPGVKAGRKINLKSNCWYVPNVPPHPYLPFSVPPADRPPLMTVTPGVEDGRVYFICSGPIGGLFVFLRSGVGRSGTIPLFIPLSINTAPIPGVFACISPEKVRHTCAAGLECWIRAIKMLEPDEEPVFSNKACRWFCTCGGYGLMRDGTVKIQLKLIKGARSLAAFQEAGRRLRSLLKVYLSHFTHAKQPA